MRTHNLYLPALFMLAFSACTHHYYAPNPVQAPLLTKKNDLIVSGALASGSEFSGFDGSVVYSPVKYGAVMTNFFNVNSDKSRPSWGEGRLFEGALGGYYPIGNGNSATLFAGYGRGRVYNQYRGGSYSDLRFQRSFIQPGLAFQESIFRAGVAMRLSYLQYRRGEVVFGLGNEDVPQSEIDAVKAIERRSNFWLPELSINAGVKLGPCYLYGQSTLIRDNSIEEVHFAYPVYSFGLTLNLFDAFKSANKDKR